MREEKIRVAVVGLRFGAEFVPIYQNHPDVGEVILCDQDSHRLGSTADHFQIQRRFTDLDEMLGQTDIDAVHLVTPFLMHASQTLKVLSAYKHCASAVCMGSTLNELFSIVETQRRVGKNYMMMETAVYSREYLFVEDLTKRGELGELTFLRGVYFQDVEGYPDYWKSVPPMHYATHAIAPLLSLTNTRVIHVNCPGSGMLSDRIKQPGGNPYRLETALLRLENTYAAAEVTRSWFETARPYVESFSVYGTRQSFEWNQLWNEKPLLFTLGDAPRPFGGRPVDVTRADIPDFADRLPEPLRGFTQYDTDGAHGGSHPHLVHEFIRSIVEERSPAVDAVTAANWTAPGICAHQSALRDGETVNVPRFD